MVGEWHNSQSFSLWEEWKIAAREQFDNFEGDYLDQLAAICMFDFDSIQEFLTKFCTVAYKAAKEQTEFLSGNAKDAVEASFSKQCVKFLAQAFTPAYGCLVCLEKYANLETAFVGIMAQYKAAVENELDKEAKNNTEWNLYVKKKENPVVENKVSEEVVEYVKAFLAQNVAPERCGPPISYNCGTQGHILVYCTQTCTECRKFYPGTKCPVFQEHIN
ncbi:hypothetical protein DSO57_1005363 [Entomophthora muscae]|uniref:Uncharacterized protein n=1 Tax=Entomophthora muscae TaxID=34485 RepID=A0ACC2RMN7_9FUNG|nr:hypothetical protein DSO57_1005363 [Entomophthora muscae]